MDNVRISRAALDREIKPRQTVWNAKDHRNGRLEKLEASTDKYNDQHSHK